MAECTAYFHRAATYTGSDVRLATGALMRPDAWPRRTVQPSWWKWSVAMAYPYRGEHINVLELRACHAALRWRCRRAGFARSRFVHFVDSQVSLGVLAKGRSSSRQIAAVLRRYNALALAACLFAAYAWVRTDLNPADRPSRWW